MLCGPIHVEIIIVNSTFSCLRLSRIRSTKVDSENKVRPFNIFYIGKLHIHTSVHSAGYPSLDSEVVYHLFVS